MTSNFTVISGYSGTETHDIGIELALEDSEGTVTDLTGWEIVFITQSLESGPMRKTSADGGITVTPTEGRILVPISVVDSRLLSHRSSLKYEIERRNGPQQRPVLSGTIFVNRGVNDD